MTAPRMCRDCGMEPAAFDPRINAEAAGRCAGCQRDYEIRLARRLARTPKEEADHGK